MSDHIEEGREDLRLARQRISEFQAICSEFLKSNPYEVVSDQESKGDMTQWTFRIRQAKPLPYQARQLFGESINALRELCDRMFHAVAAQYFPPTARLGGLPVKEFPGNVDANGNGRGFAKWRFDNHRLPTALLDHIERIQPFNPYMTPHGRFVDKHHPLRILEECWNSNKHQIRLKVAAVNVASGVGLPGMVGNVAVTGQGASATAGFVCRFKRPDGTWQTAYDATATAGGSLDASTKRVTLLLPTSESPGNIQLPFAVNVAVDEGEPFAARRVADALLIELHEFVRNEIVEKFSVHP